MNQTITLQCYKGECKTTHKTILSIPHSSFTDTEFAEVYTSAIQKNKLCVFLNYFLFFFFYKQGLGNEALTLTSSQDILYSARTVRHRAAILCGLCQGKQLTPVHTVSKN